MPCGPRIASTRCTSEIGKLSIDWRGNTSPSITTKFEDCKPIEFVKVPIPRFFNVVVRISLLSSIPKPGK